MASRTARYLTGSLSLILALSAAGAQQGERVPISLDSLLRIRVSTASKYDQTAMDAPASITIITAGEIHRYGYRTLDEVLENVPGFYLSNDRNYSYLGTRGFSRP